MTEAEWRLANDPEPLLKHLEDRVSGRRLRLFAAACCRSAYTSSGIDEVSNQALEVAERFADGQASNSERRELQRLANGTCGFTLYSSVRQVIDSVLTHIAIDAGRPKFDDGEIDQQWPADFTINNPSQSNLLRDIFGNPFRPVSFDPAWLTTTVVALAHGIYAERAFDRMPMLADALEEAGCDNVDVLLHCRGDGPYVRGCWVVDAVLGKK